MDERGGSGLKTPSFPDTVKTVPTCSGANFGPRFGRMVESGQPEHLPSSLQRSVGEHSIAAASGGDATTMGSMAAA